MIEIDSLADKIDVGDVADSEIATDRHTNNFFSEQTE